MMTFTDKKAMERAYAKAQQVKPKARELSFGVYSVTGSKGDVYTVTFKKLDGQLQGECTCKAHVASAQPKMCFHIMSVTGHYKMKVRERAAARHTCVECKTVEVKEEGRLCAGCLDKLSSELFG